MDRKSWLVLSLFSLIFLYIVCIYTHRDLLKNDIAKDNTNTQKVISVVQKPQKKVYQDVKIKITKDTNSLILSGVLNNKKEFEALKSNFQNLKTANLSFNQNVKNPDIISKIISLKDIIKKFKRGFIEYSNKHLSVEGVVESKDDKNLIESVLASIKDISVDTNIIVDEPKKVIEHISKLSILKTSDSITISGTFSSQDELNSLVEKFKSRGLRVNKGLCVIDSDLKDEKWKEPVDSIIDDFVLFDKGAIQFDKDKFLVSGEVKKDGIKESINTSLKDFQNTINISEDIVYKKPTPTREQIEAKIKEILRLKHIRFHANSDELTEDSKPILDEVIEVILTVPNLKIEIDGYTDSDGDETKNLILSQKRADRVKEYLVEHGIKEENLKAVGFGEANPIVKNDSPENKQINRRVEFKILGE